MLSNEIIIPYKKPDNLVDLGENFVKPEKKPGLTDLTKYKIKKKSFLLPEKKPSKVVLEEVKTSEIQKKIVEEVAVTADQEAKIILPEKKPITYKKKIEKIAKKSEYFSKKDFKLSQKIFTNVDKRKWTKALNLAKKAENRSLYKLVKWLYLLERNNQATFYDYINFINLNPSYPRLGRLRYLAEHKITIKSVDTNRIIKFFFKYHFLGKE